MQLVVRGFIIILVLYLSLLFFMPKKEFYYFGEKELKKYSVIIGEEELRETLFTLKLNKGKLFFKNASVASFETINISTKLFLSSINIYNLKPELIPIELEKIELSHSILTPFVVDIDLVGDVAEGSGVIDLDKRVVKIVIKEKKSKSFNQLRRYLKKTKQGWVYETNF